MINYSSWKGCANGRAAMSKRLIFVTCLVAFGLLGGLRSALAALPIYIDAVSGSDSGSCGTVTAPCQTMTQAVTRLNATGAPGIVILRGTIFSPIIISQSTYIEGPADNSAQISGSSGSASCIGSSCGAYHGHAIEITSPTAIVKISDLSLAPGSGSGAIEIYNAEAVRMVGVVFRGGTNNNNPIIEVKTPHNLELNIQNSDVGFAQGNANAGGILVQPLGGNVLLRMDNMSVHDASYGLLADATGASSGSVKAFISDSSFYTFSADAIHALSNSGGGNGAADIATVRVNIVNAGGDGIHSDGGNSAVLLNQDSIVGNGGFDVDVTNGAGADSMGNNMLGDQNPTNGTISTDNLQ
jgi:hypothetical protein